MSKNNRKTLALRTIRPAVLRQHQQGHENNTQTPANTQTSPIKSPRSTRSGVPVHLASSPSAFS
jgi:hypothetical protein